MNLPGVATAMRLTKRFAPVFGVRAADVAVRFGFNLALARALGADGSGSYYLALSVVTIAASVARLGLDTAAVRYVSVALDEGNLARARGTTFMVLAYVAVVGLALSGLLLAAAGPLSHHLFDKPDFVPVLKAFALGTAMLALDMAVASLLSAFGRPVASQVVGTMLWPTLTLPILLFGPFTAPTVAHIAVTAMALAATGGLVLVLGSLGARLRPVAFVPMRSLVVTGLPLFGTEMVFLLFSNLPIVVLGVFSTATEVGLFAVASRISLLLAVFTLAMTAVSSPHFARLYAAGDSAGLQAAANDATRMVGAACATAALVIMLFPELLLRIFGASFVAAAPMLIALSAGQLVAGLLAPSTPLLSMTGGERALWRTSLFSFAILVMLLLVLVPPLGGLGAAIAAGIGTAAYSGVAAIVVHRRLGIHLHHAYRVRRRP